MSQQVSWRVIRILFSNLGRFRLFFFGVFLVGFLDGCVGFFAPVLLAKFTATEFSSAALWRLIPWLALLYFVSHILQWILRRYGESFGPEYSAELRQKYFRALEAMSLSHLSRYHSGYLLSIVGAVADGLGALAVEILWGVSRGIASLLLFFYFSLEQSVPLGLVNITLLFIFISISVRFSKGMVPITARVNLRRSALGGCYADFSANVGTVKRLGIQKFAESRIREASEGMLQAVKELQAFHARRWFSLHSLFSIAMIVTISFLLYRISQGAESASILILFVAAFTAVRINAERLSENFRSVMELDTYVENMHEVFETSNLDASNSSVASVNPPAWQEIKFQDVSFQHSGSAVLIRIPALHIANGERLGIVGSSGEGKTTLLNLIARLHRPKTGTIFLDSTPYAELSDAFFSEHVMVASQGAELFNFTVRDNILLGRSEKDEVLMELLAELGLDKWISGTEGKLDAVIGERGATVSEGQKQRLNLLRAYFLDRDLILLDEPAAHLDEENRLRVKNFILKRLKGKTVVLVSHQKDLLECCERIVEMSENTLQPSKA